ncbi:HAD family hydrolase [Corynebacterium pacaense]|uniref:HAD family hydrolase n=1 Tax=Corynebacterium pacaense TaxID=1816684 RepID=UPI0009BA72E2|nr:HAD family hydrolase [Corynebacterium pacaense]
MKLMAFDLDGTLLFNGTIAPGALRAIRDWRSAGNLAVLATGKSIHATRQALEGIDIFFDDFVLYTGAVVTDSDFRVRHSSTISHEVLSGVVELLGGCDEQINVYATTLDTPDALILDRISTRTTGILVNPRRMDPSEIPEHTFIGVPIWIPDNEDLITRVQRSIAAEFPGVDCHRNQDFLDIVPGGATKGSGLQRLLDSMDGVSGGVETFTIGDSWNDLDMHRWADVSASFTYSPREVRAETTMVVDTAEEFIARVL